ncbi:MAG TPA: cupin domain-containing protein [Bryobacteraceae bacterium]|nr:cupin domain-containing protein [Bryobacteraceae bacterium]
MPEISSNYSANAPKREQKATRTPRRVGEALKVGAVAKRLGVSASMVRSWEKLGLASPARSQSKYRLYTNDDIRVLRRAIYLRRVRGLNAPAILHELKQEGLLNQRAERIAEKEPSIGPRFRKLRLQRGESLATVAGAVGVSIGFLSNLERSQSGASIGIMRKLAQYYGLNILDLFNPIDGTGPLVRPRERKSLEGGPGVRMELLASGKITMEPHLFRISPGAGSGESYAHEGEEFLYVVRGRLQIRLGDEDYQLHSGDGFYFTSKTPHRWCNPGKTETLILWINTPPTF